MSAGGGGSGGPDGGAAFGTCSAPAPAAPAAGFAAGAAGRGAAAAAGLAAAAGAAGFEAAAGAAAFAAGGTPPSGALVGDVALRCPVAELVSPVTAVCCAVGWAGFGASGLGAAPVSTGAADAPAPGESVRDTSAFNGSAGALLAGLSAAAVGGVGVSPGFVESSAI
jgi:hypothetical protein